MGYLAVEALKRIYDFFVLGTMEDVDGKFMSIIAAIGVLVNIALAIVLGGANPELPGGGHDHAGHDHGDGHEHGDHDHDDHGHGDEHGGHGTDDGHDHKGHDHGGHDHKSHDHGAAKEHASEQQHAGEATPLTVASGGGAATATKKKEEKRNVALQAAYLHVLGDLLQSFAVLVAGLIIWFFPSPNVRVIDPIATLLFCIVVFYS